MIYMQIHVIVLEDSDPEMHVACKSMFLPISVSTYACIWGDLVSACMYHIIMYMSLHFIYSALIHTSHKTWSHVIHAHNCMYASVYVDLQHLYVLYTSSINMRVCILRWRTLTYAATVSLQFLPPGWHQAGPTQRTAGQVTNNFNL